MGQNNADESSPQGSRREAALRLILLAVALILVCGYALMITDIGVAFLGDPRPLLLALGAAAAIVVILLAVLALRRRRRRKSVAAAPPADATAGLATLAGRDQFMRTLDDQIRTHMEASRQLAVHLVDIDRFANVNDVLGVEEGDKFLRIVAERLLVLVNQPDRLARIGDDEFAIIQPEAGGARHAEIYARRIEDILKDACALLPRHARPGASIGVAVAPENGESAARLMQSASLALHAAKNAGGDTFRIYSRDMEMLLQERLRMEDAISDGLHEGWFELSYQPQYDLRTRRLTGFEALVRMNHPDLGPLLPEVFLPSAEECGLIQPLGEWIVREALTAAMEWPNHLNLAINVSRRQFRSSDVATTIINALSNADIDPTRLRVEIPEALLRQESSAADEQLRRMQSRGIVIVIDDFGVGTSKLRALSGSPCRAIKLDRTLVEPIGADPQGESLVRSLIGTARAFDLDVLAEGVEQAEQAHFLISNDCHNVQGYLFGKPAPIHEVAAIIAKDLRNATEPQAQAGQSGTSDPSSAVA